MQDNYTLMVVEELRNIKKELAEIKQHLAQIARLRDRRSRKQGKDCVPFVKQGCHGPTRYSGTKCRFILLTLRRSAIGA